MSGVVSALASGRAGESGRRTRRSAGRSSCRPRLSPTARGDLTSRLGGRGVVESAGLARTGLDSLAERGAGSSESTWTAKRAGETLGHRKGIMRSNVEFTPVALTQ